ncbi:MAG TPA: hypothetical protein VNE39_23190 [Planctomycetota bacterium]|nr:hypothetical protein [Planctomycetota bacterium]
MWKRLLPCAFAVLAAAAAAAGESQSPTPGPRPKPKEEPTLPTPTEDELDKPGGKPIVPRPTPIATPDAEKGGRPDHVNPFRQKAAIPKYARPARITFSDKKTLEGHVWHRAGSPVRIYNRAAKAHEDYFFSDLKRIDVTPETENFERDWRWKNQGSSEKVFLDTGYFWNQYVTTFTLTNGEKPAGDCSGQFTIQLLDGARDKWFLYKRHSAREVPGVPHKKREDLEPLVYVKSVEFTDDFLKKPEPGKAPPKDAPVKTSEAPAPPKTENR